MPRLLSLSRAARLVGTTRGKLQRQVQDGEINSFEGKISLAQLAELYPQAKIEDTVMLDRVEEIIERARFKARNRIPLPADKESLLARASVLGDELTLAKLDLSNYAIFIHKLKSKLKHLCETDNDQVREILQGLNNWIQDELPMAAETAEGASPLLVQDTMLRLITAQIQLLPSGHEYLLEGNTSLLEAGLSAGFALNYGCSNGNCGKCKAKLISGKVKKTRPYDFSFTEAEKAQNYILTCSHTALTDVVLEADEAHDTHDIPLQNITAKVKKLEAISDEVSILNLKTPRTRRLRFLAGQQARLSINDTLSKLLPIASCPCDDMNIQFHIEHANDPFSQYIITQLKSGSEISIEGPQGEFILDDDAPNPIIFIAMDTGFAPIKSLIEHAMTLSHAENISLYWLTSNKQAHYMRNQCRAWDDAFDSFRYIEQSLQSTLDSDIGQKELNTQLGSIIDAYPSIENCHIYLAGNKHFINVGKSLFDKISAPRLLFEQLD